MSLGLGQVDLYESELDDNGVARMSVKVRVMPSGWYALLRFWLRVDGVLMRLRDTRFHCPFDPPAASAPYVLREICDREDSLAPGKGVRLPPAALSDPNIAEKMLTARNERTEMLLL
jgi:type 2A phosphatase activator TIP41